MLGLIAFIIAFASTGSFIMALCVMFAAHLIVRFVALPIVALVASNR